MPPATCRCYTPPFHFADFKSGSIGTDETNGRFAEVTVETCVHCATKWIRYFVEYEAFSQSGRWYRAIITDSDLQTIRPETTISYIEDREWYIYGGSYFSSAGQYGRGAVFVDR